MELFARSDKAGTYQTSFLYMIISSFEDLRDFPGELDDERAKALFVHEYVHYIQDITTTYSYAVMSTFVDQMKWAVDKATKLDVLEVPFDPEDEELNFIRINEINRKDSIGSGRVPDIKIESIERLSYLPKNITVDGVTMRIPIKFLCQFKDQSGNSHKYAIGSHTLCESMAYLVEKRLYGNILGIADDAPYNIVEKVMSYACPEYCDSDSMIIMCDVCLMHPFPGIAFGELVGKLRRQDHKLSPQEIFNLGVSREFLAQSGINECWVRRFLKEHEQAKQQMMDYFVADVWNDTKEAISVLFDNAKRLRINNPLFMLDIAHGGKLESNEAFMSVLNQLGFLCAVTADDRVYTLNPSGFEGEIEQDLLISLHQCFDIFLKGCGIYENYNTKRCELFERCHRSYIDQRLNEKGYSDLTGQENEHCTKYPWNQTTPEALNQCAFGRLWYCFGLEGKEIIGHAPE